MKILPRARTENTVVQHLNDEVLIYDVTTNLTVCLNVTSANVFNACDGKTSLNELKSRYNYTDEIIYLALDGLQEKNLLADDYVSPFRAMNRREVIRRVGLASMVALPVIIGLTAPKAANAASGGFCNTAGRTCVASGTNACNGRAAGTYAYSANISGTGTSNGTCGGTSNFNGTFNCPAIATAGVDVCVANNPI